MLLDIILGLKYENFYLDIILIKLNSESEYLNIIFLLVSIYNAMEIIFVFPYQNRYT